MTIYVDLCWLGFLNIKAILNLDRWFKRKDHLFYRFLKMIERIPFIFVAIHTQILLKGKTISSDKTVKQIIF